MASGSIAAVTLPAPVDATHQVIVTATYEAQGQSGGDWGTNYTVKCYVIQNGSTVYGDAKPLTTTRTPYTVQYTFSVSQGYTITAGVYCTLSGAVAATFYNIKLVAELIKR